MRVTAVIPTINEAANIARAVESCWQAGLDEVVVADGGSEDGTRVIAADHGARVVLGNRGRAEQMNHGARYAACDVLLFLHADNWLEPAGGQQLRLSLENPNVVCGAFLQRIEAPGLLYRLIELGNAMRVRLTGIAYGDQAIFLRRETFEYLGGFPPVAIMEDYLLMRAFRKVGTPIVLPGPVQVSARRWQQHGVVRQTLRNWSLLGRRAIGQEPNRLARFYPAHDQL